MRRSIHLAICAFALFASASLASAEEFCSYGPGSDIPRQTLFQWSYGTSFGGGGKLDEPLVTDRPDFTEASTTVGRNVAQLEMGYTFERDTGPNMTSRSHSFPEALLRVGVLADWLELRMDWNYINSSVTDMGLTTVTNGSEDLRVGFKIALTPQEGLLPEMALLGDMHVPTGATGLGATEVRPAMKLIYGWEVCDWISTAGQTGMGRAIDDSTAMVYGEFVQSWTIGYSLTDQIGAYTEWYVIVPDGADSARTEHIANGGFTYLWSDDVQLDVRAGVGLNDAAPDYFVGTGISMRF